MLKIKKYQLITKYADQMISSPNLWNNNMKSLHFYVIIKLIKDLSPIIITYIQR